MKTSDTDEGPSSIWDALLGYGSWGYTEPERYLEGEYLQSGSHGRWLLEDDDFSSEHGYEPVGGRTEFAYGEFDRWL